MARLRQAGGVFFQLAGFLVGARVIAQHSRRHALTSICWSPRGTERRNHPGSVTVNKPAGL